MKSHSLTKSNWTCRLGVTLAAVAVCASTVVTVSAVELLAGVMAKNKLVMFSSTDPEDVAVVHLSGLALGEEVLGLDVRPATGELYALGSSARLYTVDALTGQATAIGAGPFTNMLSGTKFGFDFNPTVDRIRLVSDSGLNLRLNPTNGLLAAVDGSLAYATNDSGFGMSPMVVGAAYINNDTDTNTATVLYDIDAARDMLVVQTPPNNGTLVTVGPLGVKASGVVGFDVAGSDGTAYASIVPTTHKRGKHDDARLYTIDLTTGAATCLGRIGGSKPISSLTALGPVEDSEHCNRGHGRSEW